jgi:SAM-dependent methyltransferase
MRDDVLTYYRRGGEATRLTGVGRIEFIRTWDILGRVLPRPPARVLDVGGATGVYAAPLAAAGYGVHVVDAVPEHVSAAATITGVTAAVGDARALPVGDGEYDATLLFGPLYHLLDRADRVRSWREAGRAVRPGGVVVAATISRFASMLDGFAKGFNADPEYRPVVDHALRTGEHRPADNRWFTTAYFHHPDEIPGEVADAGLTLDRIAAVEGPLWMIRERLDDEALVLDRLRLVEAEPSLFGASGHLLTVARTAAA